MSLLWPGFLVLLATIPLLIAFYIWMQRRRRRFAVRFSSLSLVREAKPNHSRWRRYLPPALFLLALASLVFALARPVTVFAVPSSKTTIIMAMDVSRSMCSTDIPPNRLVAAQNAALTFIEAQRPDIPIGIVAFAGFAELIQAPTTDREALRQAILSLTTGRRTAIGSAIIKSLEVIAEADPDVPPPVTDGASAVAPVVPGQFAPHIIVLLTDGANNAGPRPEEAAQQAADRGIRVYTIGFGTAQGGEMPNCNPRYVGNEPYSGYGMGGGAFGGGFGGQFRRGIDEETLKRVAAMTAAEYYPAESVEELVNAFRELPTHLIAKYETQEISFAFAALGALLAAVAFALSLLWHPLL
ncbi:MAG: VWA domain-containing protein [Anaerolineae bacterium]|nr:VWA domain-containing protein [Candidatus Roseilinea sp.]MDW8451233.1 VWA domain-containing protein [Anaerolineae bacterium]